MTSQSDPKKRHDERNDEDEGRAGDCERWRAYVLCADDGMKSIEQKWITNRRRCGNQSQIVKALLKNPSAVLRANECFHHRPMKPQQRNRCTRRLPRQVRNSRITPRGKRQLRSSIDSMASGN